MAAQRLDRFPEGAARIVADALADPCAESVSTSPKPDPGARARPAVRDHPRATVSGHQLPIAAQRHAREPIRWMRRPGGVAVFAWAARALERRAAVVILTARFVPFGRIAVNLTAGATRFRFGRFLPLSVIAGCGWSLYNALIGALFGNWFRDNPVLAVVLSIIVAVGLGLLVDQLSARAARPVR